MTLQEHFEQGFQKRAEGYQGTPTVNMQQYAPLGNKRDFSPQEQSQISDAEGKILPKIFKSNIDPIAADMSSPGWSSVLPGAAGLAGGGVLGSMLGSAFDSNGGNTGAGIGTVLGMLGGGALGGTIGYKGREATNNTLKDYMSRLPEGATRRDLHSDPVYQKELDRSAMLQAAMAAGLANRRY